MRPYHNDNYPDNSVTIEKVGFPHPPVQESVVSVELSEVKLLPSVKSESTVRVEPTIYIQQSDCITQITKTTIRSCPLSEPQGQGGDNSQDIDIQYQDMAMSEETREHVYSNHDVPLSINQLNRSTHAGSCYVNLSADSNQKCGSIDDICNSHSPDVTDATHVIQPSSVPAQTSLPPGPDDRSAAHDFTIPWDPGEINDIDHTTPKGYTFIQPEKLGTQEVSEMNNVEPYVRAMVNGYETLMLVDTGASRSILSEDFAKFIGILKPNDPIKTNLSGQNASGGKIHTYGYRQVLLQINGIVLEGDIMVGKVNESGFLGMDILSTAGAYLDFNEMNLLFCGQKVPLLSKNGKRLVNSLITIRKTRLPKYSETVVNLRFARGVACSGTGLVEPRESVLNHYGIVGARNLGTSDNLCIKLLNPNPVDVHLPAGTSVAYFTDHSQLKVKGNMTCDYKIHSAQVADEYEDDKVPEHCKDMYEKVPDEITTENKAKLRQLLTKYGDVFSKTSDDLGFCDWIQHEIKLKPGTKPIRQAPYIVGHFANKEIEKNVKTLLDKDIIQREYNSQWSSPCVLVMKKDSTTRFCQDYRQVNKVSEQDSYRLPRQDESLEALSGAKYVTTADLTSGYHQVALSPEAQKISTFVTKSGLYSFKRTPMGLHGSSHTFERLMETVMRGLQWEELLVYMDDIVVFSPDQESHIERLDRMLHRLQQANLKIKPKKTHLFQKKVEYLGHIVDEHGIHTDPKKIKAIQGMASPKNKIGRAHV